MTCFDIFVHAFESPLHLFSNHSLSPICSPKHRSHPGSPVYLLRSFTIYDAILSPLFQSSLLTNHQVSRAHPLDCDLGRVQQNPFSPQELAKIDDSLPSPLECIRDF